MLEEGISHASSRIQDSKHKREGLCSHRDQSQTDKKTIPKIIEELLGFEIWSLLIIDEKASLDFARNGLK